MKKLLTITCSLTILSIALITSAANAETLCETSLTGYIAMGGSMGGYQTEDANDVKNYSTIGSLAKSTSFWTFGWLKFDQNNLPASSVPKAYLAMEACASGAHGASQTPVNMDVAIQNVDSDVSDILFTDFDGDNLIDQSDLTYYVNNSVSSSNEAVQHVTNVGAIYYWDITSLVNGWIADPASNKGFVVTGWGNEHTMEDDFGFVQFAGIPTYDNAPNPPVLVSRGAVPALVTSVPEPSTVTLILAAFACSGIILHRRRQAA